MNYIGLDLGKNNSQICLLTEEGEIVEKRIKTEREVFAKFFGQYNEPSRILLEASTESEWVARCLEELGCEVIVADPNFAPMYSTRSKKIKTDKRDARALCEACRLGAYRRSHRVSDNQRLRRSQLAVRETMVRTRAKYICLIRTILRAEGWRVGTGSSRLFVEKVEQLILSPELTIVLEPLLKMLENLNEQIKKADHHLAAIVAEDQKVHRLAQVPGIGAVTATAFVAVIDEVERFGTAKQVRSYLGLVPQENSSGEKQHRGRISKTGNSRIRQLLVEVSWGILCVQKRKETEGLRRWATRIAERRGRRIATVALARKLAGILYAMWRDGTEFDGRLTNQLQPLAIA